MSSYSAGVERDFQINGLKLHAHTWGEFTSPDRAVFLIHGLSANSMEWADFGPFLAGRGWYAVAPDLRGRGLSDKPAHGYGTPFHANDMLSLADTLGLSRLNLVGHSLGALISLFLAAVHPERAGKVVLVDAGGIIPQDTVQAIAPSIARLDNVYPSLEAFLELMSKAPLFEWNPFWENYFRYDALVRADGTVKSRVARATIEEENFVTGHTRFENLPNFVKSPTLIARATVGMLGPDRGLILPAEEAERMRRIIPGSRVVEVPGVNHYTIALSELFKREAAAFLELAPVEQSAP
jgi:pimeloyl-ACP methyl ester carboxylesterase